MQQTLTLALALGGFLGVLLVLHKVRRLHIRSFELLELARESAQTYRQIEALHAIEQMLRLDRPLPPLRGWAASPDFLRILAEDAIGTKPERIVECGSGASTLVLAYVVRMNGKGKVYSLEHSPAYAQGTRALLDAHGLTQWAEVVVGPLLPHPGVDGAIWYAPQAIALLPGQVDMLVVDGPPSSAAADARLPALPLLRHLLADGARVYLDDSMRPGERRALDRWTRDGLLVDIDQLPAEKGCIRGRFTPTRSVPARE